MILLFLEFSSSHGAAILEATYTQSIYHRYGSLRRILVASVLYTLH